MYADMIRKAIAKKYPDVDPMLVEHWMRLQYSTLDHLDKTTFNREARLGASLVVSNPVESAMNAASYGEKPEAIAKALKLPLATVEGYLKVEPVDDDTPFVLKR